MRQDKNGHTALHWACKAGKEENVRAIIEHAEKTMGEGAFDFVDLLTNGGNSALMFAVQSLNIKVLAHLLNAGPNPHVKNSVQQDALIMS